MVVRHKLTTKQLQNVVIIELNMVTMELNMVTIELNMVTMGLYVVCTSH